MVSIGRVPSCGCVLVHFTCLVQVGGASYDYVIVLCLQNRLPLGWMVALNLGVPMHDAIDGSDPSLAT